METQVTMVHKIYDRQYVWGSGGKHSPSPPGSSIFAILNLWNSRNEQKSIQIWVYDKRKLDLDLEKLSVPHEEVALKFSGQRKMDTGSVFLGMGYL